MLAFVHIPKTAGGSIKWWIKQYNLPVFCSGHKSLAELKQQSNSITKSFCVTRNTYARMISVYVFAEYKAHKRLSKRNDQLYKPAKDMLAMHQKGIEYFIEWMVDCRHVNVRSQMGWIQDVDYVLSQENINQEFKIIQDLVNCKHPLPNSVHKLNYNPALYYTSSYISCINRLFADEIEYFKYAPSIL